MIIPEKKHKINQKSIVRHTRCSQCFKQQDAENIDLRQKQQTTSEQLIHLGGGVVVLMENQVGWNRKCAQQKDADSFF